MKSSTTHMSYSDYSKSKGFTLIELIVAMAIFAVLTLAGWQVFNNLIKVRDRTTLKAEQITTIQQAYEQLSRDFVQAVPRAASIGETIEPAFYLQNNEFHLTKTGVIDPLQLGNSPLERVQYLVVQNQLIRKSFSAVDQDGNLVPTQTVLLDHVTDWTVSALSSSSTTIWPVDTSTSTAVTTQTSTSAAASAVASSVTATQNTGDVTLPLAVEIDLTTNGQSLRWVFPFVGNLPQSNTASASSVTATTTTSSTASINTIASGGN